MMDCFIPKFRTFVAAMLHQRCGDAYAKLVSQNLNLKEDPDKWDLANLITIFMHPEIMQKVFMQCFDNTK